MARRIASKPPVPGVKFLRLLAAGAVLAGLALAMMEGVLARAALVAA